MAWYFKWSSLGEVQLYFSCTLARDHEVPPHFLLTLDKINLNGNHYISMQNYTISTLTLNTILNWMAISTENSVLTLNKIKLNDSQYGVLLFPVLTLNKMKSEWQSVWRITISHPILCKIKLNETKKIYMKDHYIFELQEKTCKHNLSSCEIKGFLLVLWWFLHWKNQTKIPWSRKKLNISRPLRDG